MPPDGLASWNLTPEQIKLTQDLKAVFATPIKGDRGENPIGVLSFDSKQEYLRSSPQQRRLVNFFANDNHFRDLAAIISQLVFIILDYFNITWELK
jgi:hypothetical protein